MNKPKADDGLTH